MEDSNFNKNIINELLLSIYNTKYDELNEKINDNILKLAYIGDAIFDIFTRDYNLKKFSNKLKINEIHKKNSDLICAKSQSQMIEKLIDDNFINEEEIEIYKKGRNAHSNTKSKNSSIVEYRKATGFECLIGYLFYKNNINRICEIFNYLLK